MGIIVKNLNIKGKIVVGPNPTNNDVIPNPTPNWTDIVYDGSTGTYGYSSQQIQGINTSITIKLTYNDSTLVGLLYYYVGSSEPIPNTGQPPSAQSTISGYNYFQINNNGTFTVSNNQWVSFGIETSGTDNGTVIITVKNQSNSDVTLDQFNMITQNIIT